MFGYEEDIQGYFGFIRGYFESIQRLFSFIQGYFQSGKGYFAKSRGFLGVQRTIFSFQQTTSGGDPVKIQSAGFDVASDGAPVHMTKVENLGAAVGDSPGEIDLNWNPVAGAKSYQIQTSTDPNTPASWAFKDNATKSKATLDGLTSASRIWVRVRAIGANEKGGWSDPAESVVP